MMIPVFVSAPTSLNPEQSQQRKRIVGLLKSRSLKARALGRKEYPTVYPLKEVAVIAKHCSGGVILGFKQFEAKGGTWKPGAADQWKTSDKVAFPTPWNQLEAGILFGLHLPLLIFREDGVSGGVFDAGVTDVYVHQMPPASASPDSSKQLTQLVDKWAASVRQRYYAWDEVPK